MTDTVQTSSDVRELDHIVERAVLLAGDDAIEPQHLRIEEGGGVLSTRLPLMTLDEAEKALMTKTASRKIAFTHGEFM